MGGIGKEERIGMYGGLTPELDKFKVTRRITSTLSTRRGRT